MKVLVAYMSKTGNTRKVAEAIFREIGEEKDIKKIDQVESLEGYDLAFLGFPIHGLGPDEKAKAFLEIHTKDKKVALFITQAFPESHEELPSHLAKFQDATAGGILLGVFNCQGELAEGMRFVMRIHPNAKLRAWAQEDDSRGKPDAARLQRARVYAREIMAKAS